ncbi:MAG: exodeoxyribonuclease III [Hyphomicrobiaceae bacterium]|nr:exodeoxyribonuclease III [Hyphomicrobiaceae bacterium]
MPRLSIATWNINSVRLRAGLVEHLLGSEAPDVLCLQETKCHDAQFPLKLFEQAGYGHLAINGQKGYHGVAIASRLPLDLVEKRDFCGKGDARHIAASVAIGGRSVRIDNLYVPAGGDEPDPAINDKFAHKLQFLDELEAWIGAGAVAGDRVVVGDLNIAPFEHDVWSHKQLLGVVSHTPIETRRFEEVRNGGRWIDVMRRFTPEPQKLYTWWSYRAADWAAANKGRRLDHVWASPALEPTLSGARVITQARGWEKPSDHAPVIATFEM